MFLAVIFQTKNCWVRFDFILPFLCSWKPENLAQISASGACIRLVLQIWCFSLFKNSSLNPLCLQPCKLKQDFEMGLDFELGIRRGQKQAEIKSPGVYNRPDLSKTTIFIFGRFYIIDFCMIFLLMLWTPPKDRFLHNRLASFTRLTKTYDTFN